MTSMMSPLDWGDLVLDPVDVPDATVPNVGDEGTTTIEGGTEPLEEPFAGVGDVARDQMDAEAAMDSVWTGFLLLMGLAAVVAIARGTIT